MKLGMGKCRLSVQAPRGRRTQPGDLAGRRIVTSFPNLSRRYFASLEDGTPTQIRSISGSVEAACGLGLADGIVDLVETGTTMRAAGRRRGNLASGQHLFDTISSTRAKRAAVSFLPVEL
jgi:ATP phosphoribosyltransferase